MSVPMILVGIFSDFWFPWLFLFISLGTVLTLFFLMLLHESIKDFCIPRIKIEKDSEYSYDKYRVLEKRLFFPFPFCYTWMPSQVNWHSFETQNMFGAKLSSAYSTEVRFDNLGDAEKCMTGRQQMIENRRREFFEKPKKEKNKTIKSCRT